MKYIRFLAVALMCCLLLNIPVLALSRATDVLGNATVDADGSCLVELTITVQLDSAHANLTFPLPADAKEIRLGGQPAQAKLTDGKLQVQLPELPAGRHTFLVHYRLPAVVRTEKGRTFLSLPLLSSFPLDIDRVEFTVTLPGAITGRPVFFSGYNGENIRLDTSLTGNTLLASTQEQLKGYETLRLELDVEPEMFTVTGASLLSKWDWACLVLIVLAMVYFVLTLMPKFYVRSRSYTAPEGITAGEVGCCLTGSGTDLSMMVLSWAQLGYLQLELDRRGRLLLHKQMEMGNERSYHEGRIFQILFGRRATVDAASAHYARILRKVAGRSPLHKQLYMPRSGDMRIFRILCCGAGLCSGVQMLPGRPFLAFLMGLLALVLSFGLQAGGKCIPLRSKLPLLVALCCGGIWILLGNLTDAMGRAIMMVLFQFLVGLLSAYGGKRSQLGQRVLTQLMGLRHHMLTAHSIDLQQLQQKNPNYFYEMIPYALAMGIDRKFARRFDQKAALPECLWLRDAPKMNPQQCAAKLRQITEILDKARYRKV